MAEDKKIYTSDYLLRPGMTFAVDIADPKERVQAYLDSFKNDPGVEVGAAAVRRNMAWKDSDVNGRASTRIL